MVFIWFAVSVIGSFGFVNGHYSQCQPSTPSISKFISGLIDFIFSIICLSLFVFPLTKPQKQTSNTSASLKKIKTQTTHSERSNTFAPPVSMSGTLNTNSMIIAPNPFKMRSPLTPSIEMTMPTLTSTNSCTDNLPPMIDVKGLSPVSIAMSLGASTPQLPPRAFRSVAGMRISESLVQSMRYSMTLSQTATQISTTCSVCHPDVSHDFEDIATEKLEEEIANDDEAKNAEDIKIEDALEDATKRKTSPLIWGPNEEKKGDFSKIIARCVLLITITILSSSGVHAASVLWPWTILSLWPIEDVVHVWCIILIK